MSEPLEIQIARMQEQLKSVIAALQEDRESRKEFEKELIKIGSDVEVMKKQLAEHAPTISEFLIIKQQVKGAGIMGRWAWLAGGSIIGFLFTSREAIRAFFN